MTAEIGRPTPAWQALAPALQRAELSMGALYLRYVALGGSSTSASLANHFADGRALAAGELDLAVLAINERFLELHLDDPLPYVE